MTVPELTVATFVPGVQTVALNWNNVADELGYVVETLDENGAWVAASETLPADTTTWTTDKLELGATYSYRVVAKNNAGDGVSEAVSFTTPDVPAAPTDLTVSHEASENPTATLNWYNNATTETGCRVELLAADGETWETVATLEADATEWTTETLELGATYNYRVVAVNAYGETASETATAVVGDVPAAPDGVSYKVNAGLEPTAEIYWNYAEAPISYVVTVLDADGAVVETQTVQNGSGYVGCTTQTLEFGATYSVYVVAQNAYGDSAASEAVTFVVGNLPNVPSGLTATVNPSANPSATLSWNYDGANYYEVTVYNADGEIFATQTVPGDVVEYTVENLAKGATYSFVVTGGNNYGETASQATEFTVGDVPAAPDGVSYKVNAGLEPTAEIYWNYAEAPISYVVTVLDADGAVVETQTVQNGSGYVGCTTQTLEFGATYSVYVVAQNAYGDSAASEAVTFVVGNLPNVPSGLTATVNPSANPSATLSWNYDGANYYEVTVYNADGEIFATQTVPGDVVEYTVENLAKGATYSFVVTGGNNYGETASQATEFTVGDVPAAPSDLVATVNASSAPTATLTWGDNATNETGYRVEILGADGETWETVATLEADATDWTTETLAKGATYSYRVVAVNAYGETASDVATAVVGDVPAAPNALQFGAYDAETGALEMSWDNVEGETRYRVEASVNGGAWFFSQYTGADKTNRVAAIKYDTPYSFRVRAENAYGESAWVENTFVPTPYAPTDLTADVNASENPTVTLTWVDKSRSETGFVVEVLGADGETWETVATLKANATTWTSETLAKGATYVYRVAVVNAAGQAASETVEFAVGDVPTDAPTDLTATLNVSSTPTATLTWADAATDETGYVVEVLGADGETWETVATLEADATTWTSETLAKGATYVYRVAAVNAYGHSAASNEATIVVGTSPAVPNAIQFGAYDAETGKLEMSWDDVEGETRYRVEASVDGGKTWFFAQYTKADRTSRVATLAYSDRPYVFRVAAENAYGSDGWVEATFVPPTAPLPTQPGAIEFGAYDPETGKLEMSWGDSENENGYRVEASVDGGKTWFFAQYLSADQTERVATIAYTNCSYSFRVRAENRVGVSDWTEGKFIPPTAPLPTQPGAIEFGAYDPETGKLEMSWGDSENENGYRVEASVDGGKTWFFAQYLSADQTERVATIAYPEHIYSFRVRAENRYDVSDWTVAEFNANETTASPISAAFAEAFDEFDFFVDEDDLDVLAKRFF